MSTWIDLEGAHNVRDLGFLPASTGVTRPGVLLRADALDALTDADVRQLMDVVGLAHVVDLRTPAERAERGRGLLGASPVQYSDLNVVNDEDLLRRREARSQAFASGAAADVIMATGYVELLELGAPAFVTALDRIVAPGGTPVLVHCAAGKDRTGVLVALLLDAAGVDRGVIVADYAATQERMTRVIERLHAAAAFQSLAQEIPSFVFEANADTMTLFLQRLDERWGGARGYFADHGSSPETLTIWQSLLVT